MESFAGELVSGEGASDIDSWEELYGLVMLGKEPQETRMQSCSTPLSMDILLSEQPGLCLHSAALGLQSDLCSTEMPTCFLSILVIDAHLTREAQTEPLSYLRGKEHRASGIRVLCSNMYPLFSSAATAEDAQRRTSVMMIWKSI